MHKLDLDKDFKMLNLAALSKQNTQAQLRSVACAGYWLESGIVGSTSNITPFNIEHDPMQTASFYKGSGN